MEAFDALSLAHAGGHRDFGSGFRAPLRELRSLVEMGIEYELEFEDEYDSGRIARLERLFLARFAICWYQSIGRVLMIALCSSRRISPLAILKSFSFRNPTRPRPRPLTRLPSARTYKEGVTVCDLSYPVPRI